MSNDLLIALRGTQEFVQIMEGVKAKRPIVPKYQVQANAADDFMQMETIKYHTGLQDGFDALYYALTGGKP